MQLKYIPSNLLNTFHKSSNRSPTQRGVTSFMTSQKKVIKGARLAPGGFWLFILLFSGVSRISFRGGGFKIFLEKWGYLHGAKRHAARGEATRLLGGFGGMLPQENFKKWFNLVRFREYFAKILSKNNLKNSHFYIKITDNVLLRTIFRGIAAYTLKISCHLCDLVCFGVQFP